MRRLVLLPLVACATTDAPVDDPCDATPVVRVTDDQIRYDLPGCATVDLRVEAVEGTGVTVRFEQRDDAVVPVVASTPGGHLERVVLSGVYTVDGDAPLRWWRQGWQSWSWSGVTDVPAGADFATAAGDGDAFDVAHETAGTSWWGALVGRSDGASLVLGALTADRVATGAAVTPSSLRWTWGRPGDALVLAPGGEVELDALWIRGGRDAVALQEAWAARAAQAVGVAPPAGEPPTGWGSWNVFYADVTEDQIRANLAAVVADAPHLDVIEIDDGWERAWGDWTANDRFPSGMADLAGDIAAAGHAPGLWMAPFYVDRGTATYAAHDDWWVRDLAGEELRFTNAGSGDYAVIDVTHPDALAWMKQQVADRVAEGFTFLKLDFLYAGAQVGLRREAVTGLEAYRIGVDALREAAGDAHLLACGAPLLPSLGRFDSFRSGADIAFSLSPDPVRAFLRWQARQTQGRSFLNGVWWWNDADVLIDRAPFTDVEVHGAVAAQIVSGGTWMLGDDLTELPADRLARSADPELIAVRSAHPRPDDPLATTSGIDASPLIELVTPDDVGLTRWTTSFAHTIAINLGDVPVEVDLPDGIELISGEGVGGTRTLAPGEGVVVAADQR